MANPFRHQPFARKAEDWNENHIPMVAGEALEALAGLPVFPAAEHTLDNLPEDRPQYFIAVRPNGDRFLIDTQGYNYGRYVARIPKETPCKD